MSLMATWVGVLMEVAFGVVVDVMEKLAPVDSYRHSRGGYGSHALRLACKNREYPRLTLHNFSMGSGVPVWSRSNIDVQRNIQVNCPLHFALHKIGDVIALTRSNFEHEFVVYLKEETA